MASYTTGGSVYRMEGAATVWDRTTAPGGKRLRLLQWVDDNGDIVNDSTLVITINGCQLTTKLQSEANVSNYGVVVWQIGPFNPGFPVESLVINTQATGHVHIYAD